MIRRPKYEKPSAEILSSVEQSYDRQQANTGEFAMEALRTQIHEKKSPNERAIEWARAGVEEAIQCWQDVGVNALDSLEALMESHKNPEEVLRRLHEAYQQLPEDLTEEAAIVLIPWHAFRGVTELGELTRQLERLITGPGDPYGRRPGEIVRSSFTNLDDEDVMYQHEHFTHPISMSEYIADKLAEDGDWGIMLVDASEEPAYMIDKPAKHNEDLGINGIRCDAMGVYEQVALMVQRRDAARYSQEYAHAITPANFLRVHNKYLRSIEVDARLSKDDYLDWNIHGIVATEELDRGEFPVRWGVS